MKHQVWYRKFMKTPKRVYVAVAVLLFVGGAGTALALQPKEQPKKVEVQQTASVQPAEEQVTPVESTPVVEQPQAPAPTAQEESPPSVTNPYIEGSSLWYVFNRRAEIDRVLPSNLGNAGSWDNRAASLGLVVDKTPEVGAVAVLSNNGVAIVEAVNADGSVSVSSMTDITSLLSAEKAAAIFYIH